MKEIKETSHNINYKKLTDLSLYHAGFEKCSPSKACGPFIRQFNVIHFIISGKGTLTIDGKTYTLSEGSAFIIPSDTVSYYKADKINPWHYAWIGYIGIDAYSYSLQLANSGKQQYILKNLDTCFYEKIIFEIINNDVFSKNKYFQASSFLFSLMHHLYEDMGIKTIEANNISLAEEIKFFIDINYTENIKIKDIAKKFSIHQNYLSKLFHEYFSVSPKTYIINKKMNKACELLALTDLTVTTVANSLGYEDALAFSKLFKKKYRLSPTHYRSQHQQMIKK